MTAHNADEYYPFDAGAGQFSSEAQWRNMWAFLVSGVVPGVTNACAPTANSTGLHWQVNTGQVFVKGHTGLVTAAFQTSDLASVAGLTAGLKRIDRLVARADFVNNLVQFDVLTGTPNASPVLPALTQTTSVWEIGLSYTKQLASTDTTLAAADVTDERTYCGVATAWQTFTPVIGGGWVRSNGTVTGRYLKSPGLVFARILYTVGSADTKGTGLTIAGLPFAPATSDARVQATLVDVSVPTPWPGQFAIATGATVGTVRSTAVFAAPGNAFYVAVDANTPFTWTTGDLVEVEMWYETAT